MTTFTGTRALCRFGIRLDRIQLPIWIAVTVLTVLSTASSFKGLYPTAADRATFAATIIDNSAYRALTGKPYDLTTLGGLTAWRVGSAAAMIVAAMSIMVVVRHSRADEETGRSELFGSLVVGRHAGLAAAVILAVLANLATGALTTIGLAGQGLGLTGAFALGCAVAATGTVFATSTAVVVQLTASARTARSIGFTVLAAAFLLRATGDSSVRSGPSWLSWLSPLGWSELVRSYATERWWVLLLPLTAAVLTSAIAVRLSAGRDVGAGLFAIRLGPARASASLSSPFGLAWRLQRGALLGWSIGFAVLGAIFGLLAQTAVDLLKDNNSLQQWLLRTGGPSSIGDAYLAVMFGLLGLGAAGYSIQAALRLRSEETGQRVEPMLATAVNRRRLVASHLAFAFGGPTVLLIVAGVFCGLFRADQYDGVGHSVNHSVGHEVARSIGAALVQLPAVWLLAAITMLLIGLLPRLTALAWGVLAICLLIGELGPALNLGHWAMDISPFAHLPQLPGGSVPLLPLVVLVVAGLVLAVFGTVTFDRRDIG